MTACELCDEETGGRYLCERHTVQLARRLDDLPILYDEVAECLVPRGHGLGEIVSTRGAAGPRSPLDEDVLDNVNTARAAEVVHLWRVDVQRVRWPRHGAPPPGQLAADCRWLAMELEWIVVHYPGTGDLAREVGELEKPGPSWATRRRGRSVSARASPSTARAWCVAPSSPAFRARRGFSAGGAPTSTTPSGTGCCSCTSSRRR